MPHAYSPLLVASRVAAALIGGYWFAWGFTSLVIALNLATGGEYEEGALLAYLLVFLTYVTSFLWSFAARSLTRVWLVLGGGGAIMTAIAWALTPTIELAH